MTVLRSPKVWVVACLHACSSAAVRAFSVEHSPLLTLLQGLEAPLFRGPRVRMAAHTLGDLEEAEVQYDCDRVPVDVAGARRRAPPFGPTATQHDRVWFSTLRRLDSTGMDRSTFWFPTPQKGRTAPLNSS